VSRLHANPNMKVKKKNRNDKILKLNINTIYLNLTLHICEIFYIYIYTIHLEQQEKYLKQRKFKNICISVRLQVNFSTTVYTGYFTSNNEPGGIENATHSTFPKLTWLFLNIVRFLRFFHIVIPDFTCFIIFLKVIIKNLHVYMLFNVSKWKYNKFISCKILVSFLQKLIRLN
jgi:hypothetical protein